MKLSILIPTYNRCKDLEHNVSMLISFIKALPHPEDVCVIISDNASTDDTSSLMLKVQETACVRINYIRQEQNQGYCKNVCLLLSRASTPWVMLLGDDDYLEPWYIEECLKQIEEHPNLGCIIPNYRDWNPVKKELGGLREENCETKLYKAGFDACIANAWRGHQVSGLCFRKENVVEEFQKREMNNLYPQIFFVSYNALRYDVIHFGEKCLVVSGVPQSQKDWNYGDDGLVNDIFENFKNLGVSQKQRALLEAYFMQVQKRYLWAAIDTNLCIEKILTGRNVSSLGRYYIAKQILHERCYTGKRLRFRFYLLAQLVLFRQLITGKPIAF